MFNFVSQVAPCNIALSHLMKGSLWIWSSCFMELEKLPQNWEGTIRHLRSLKMCSYIQCNTGPALEKIAIEFPGWPLFITGHSMGGESPCSKPQIAACISMQACKQEHRFPWTREHRLVCVVQKDEKNLVRSKFTATTHCQEEGYICEASIPMHTQHSPDIAPCPRNVGHLEATLWGKRSFQTDQAFSLTCQFCYHFFDSQGV